MEIKKAITNKEEIPLIKVDWEKCISEIMHYLNMYADYHVWKKIDDIVKKYKNGEEDTSEDKEW